MTSAHLIQWIEHPETLNRESLYELRTLIARYPYFHSLRLLYLKNLYLLHDTSFGDELRKSALFVADRSVLFYHIEGGRYVLQPKQPLLPSASEIENEEGKDRTLYLIDSFLQSAPDEQPSHTELDYAMDYTAYLLTTEPDSETVPDDGNVPQFRGQSLIDDFLSKSETPHETEWSFTEELSEDDHFAIQSEEDVEKVPEPSYAEEDKVIQPLDADRMVSEKVGHDEEQLAAASPESEADTGDTAESPVEIAVEDETFTETLAKIYVKQHRYDKALEIIKKLSLNYPKKNAYFADQIRFLEKLIINAKSK